MVLEPFTKDPVAARVVMLVQESVETDPLGSTKRTCSWSLALSVTFRRGPGGVDPARLRGALIPA